MAHAATSSTKNTTPQSIQIKEFTSNAQSYFYEQFIARQEVKQFIFRLLEMTRGLSYEDKIFFRTHAIDYLIKRYVDEQYIREIAREFSELLLKKHSPQYYYVDLNTHTFHSNLKNILLLAVGATIPPEQHQIDSERLEAWYQKKTYYSKLTTGNIHFEISVESRRVYADFSSMLVQACIASERGTDIAAQKRDHQTLMELYVQALPHNSSLEKAYPQEVQLVAIRPFYTSFKPVDYIDLNLLHKKLMQSGTPLNPFDPEKYHVFTEKLKVLCPKSANHFHSAFADLQKNCFSTKSSHNEMGLYQAFGLILFLCLGYFFITNNKQMNASQKLYSWLGLVSSIFPARPLIEKLWEKGFANRIERAVEENLFSSFRLLDIINTTTSTEPKANEAQKPKRSLLPRIPVLEVTGYEPPVFLQDDNGNVSISFKQKKTLAKLAREKATNASPTAFAYQAMEEAPAGPKAFYFQAEGQRYTFSPEAGVDNNAGDISIWHCARGPNPFYLTIKAGIEVPKEILDRIKNQAFNTQPEAGVLALKFRGALGNTRLYADKIETNTPDRALYMITHYTGNAHVRGKIPQQILDQAKLPDTYKDSIRFFEGSPEAEAPAP